MELQRFNYSFSKHFCPASSLIRTEYDGIHGYPIDIFDPQLYDYLQLEKLLNTPSMNLDKVDIFGRDGFSNVYKCISSSNIGNRKLKDQYSSKSHIMNICSSSEYVNCPLYNQNILDALSADNINNWTAKHSLCYFNKAIHDPDIDGDPINVFILGGSVTTGTSTYGCCCNSFYDKKCSVSFNTHEKYCASDKKGGKYCRWSGYFERWIQSIGLHQVNVYNMAHGGWNSPHMAGNLLSQLRQIGISSFKSTDIIFLDHSQNDALTLTSTEYRHQSLIDGLQNLIRLILSKSDKGSWPSIILLEFWPYPNNRNPINPLKYDYDLVYRSIAKQFQIPIWSYRSMIWSKYLDNHPIQQRYKTIMRFEPTHPPWYIHLLYADLIASILEHELQDCRQSVNELSIHTRSIKEMDVSNIRGITSEMSGCKNVDNPVLRIPKMLNKPPQNTEFEVIPLNSWIYKQELYHPDNPGWIAEDISPERHIDGHLCGETDSKISNEKYSSLISFPLNSNNIRFTDTAYLIRINFLRTYNNAGSVDVFLCDVFLVTLDALWEDFDYYHYSYEEERSIEIKDFQKFCKKSQSNLKLTIKHHCSSSLQSNKALSTKQHSIARKNQKFKLVSVEICEYATL